MFRQIILCSGMMRSASTWCFNVCRLINKKIAQEKNCEALSCFRDGGKLDYELREILNRKNAISAVIKSHVLAVFSANLLRLGKIKNICTIRDPRDCIASRQLFEKNESFRESVDLIKTNLEHVAFYRTLDDTLFIKYEIMMADPKAEIIRIADYLETMLSDVEIAEIQAETSLKKTQKIADDIPNRPKAAVVRNYDHLVDKTTMVHQGHIHGGTVGRWKTELTKDQIDLINKEFGDVIVKLGYQV